MTNGREEHIVDLLKAGRPPEAICEIVGLSPCGSSRALINDVARRHNVDTTPRSFQGQLPFGVTDASHRLRVVLSEYLYRLREHNDFATVSVLTGLTRNQQLNALNRPFTHNWSLSQIERLLDCFDKTLTDIIITPSKGICFDQTAAA